MVIQACERVYGMIESIVDIDDRLWSVWQQDMRKAANALGYDLELDQHPGQFDVERRIVALGDFKAWIRTLPPADSLSK